MLPATTDVAALVQVRTQPRIGGGADTGDFTSSTVPTNTQALAAIDRAGRAVAIQVGEYASIEDGSPDLFTAILDVIALRAAADIERSYVGAEATLAVALREQYATELADVVQAVREYRSTGGVTSGEGVLPLASGIEDDADVEVW